MRTANFYLQSSTIFDVRSPQKILRDHVAQGHIPLALGLMANASVVFPSDRHGARRF
jgi:hypothetical protein